MLALERQAWSDGFRHVAGVDEAGRGPLAGPVLAAAVGFAADFLQPGIPPELEGLTDSKKLTAAQRETFFEALTKHPCVAFGVGRADVADIERVNILQATFLAMRRAVDALPTAPDLVLVDGPRLPSWPYRTRAIVRGDALSLSIAAASVIAKVTRDREMEMLDRRYPQYDFARNKGYGTAAHLAALRQHGPCPCHRRTFRGVTQGTLALE